MSETLPNLPRVAWWQHVRNWLLSKVAVRIYWFVNIALLAGTAIWILRDGKFSEGVATFAKHIAAVGSDRSPLAVVQPLMWPRVDALWFVLITGAASTAGILAGLVAGSSAHRGLRSWLALMLLTAGWLTLFTTWPELAWRGQAWRLRGSVSEFELVHRELTSNWPKEDGQIDSIGPYMAYPIGNPRLLMLLKTPQVAATSVSTIERGEKTDMRFQLAGNDEGVWLVRETGVDQPQAFFSGLDGEYIPIKYAPLLPSWFLVQYKFAPILPDESREISRPLRK